MVLVYRRIAERREKIALDARFTPAIKKF